MTSKQTIRWGVLGCGGIAKKFIASSKVVETAEVVAVASASGNKAQAFADEQGVGIGYSGYDALLEDPSVDAVYVANTHNFHHDTVLKALKADKAVLCEKPMAINAKQTKEMIDLARERNLFLMEAMWTRYLPSVVQMRKWIEEGRIGKPRRVYANFGLRMSFPPESRMVNPDLAGGALLDLGIYPLSLASMIASGAVPKKVFSIVGKGETGVDVDDLIMLSYEDGLGAQLSCGLEVPVRCYAEVVGEKGTITLPHLFIGANSVTLKTDEEEQTFNYDFPEIEGFRFEVEEACKCLLNGEKESSIMPLDETLVLAQTMDLIRADCGLKYPGE
ncbi:Gfo/Idh/MocA family oxidoreductase [Puniceicoccaceae bacterium K14]|nr:Gfo/Idh/MocA family oxidoreductase [Puniceicoccaceae bacterium K14]